MNQTNTRSIDTKTLFDGHQFGNNLGLFYYMGYNEIRHQMELTVVVMAKHDDGPFRLDGTDNAAEVFRRHLAVTGECEESFFFCSYEQREWLDNHYTPEYCHQECLEQLVNVAQTCPETLNRRSVYGSELLFRDLNRLYRPVDAAA